MATPPLISRLDLNLIVSLDALLTERNVTRAAESLRLSQPALSASLAKLRRHFNDPLLVRNGNSSELTPLAHRLSAHVPAALDSFRRVFESQAEWAPETSEREFRIYGSDYAFATVGHSASRIAHQSAPGVKFRFELHTPAIVNDSAQLRASDGILIPHGHVDGLRHTDLWTDTWVVLADASHPTIRGSVTLDDLRENPWVFTYQSPSAFTSANKQLEAMGVEPKVDTVVASFLALPHFIRGTTRLGMAQAGLAHDAEHLSGLQVLRPPFDTAPVANSLWWHAIHENDPEHEWMRGIFATVGRELAQATRMATRNEANT